jgi:trehalose 6-phosphate synthase
MSRLIVISNRVAAARAHGEAGAQGGLAVALGAALREHRGIWFGWSGEETPSFTGHLDLRRVDGVTTATIDLEPQDIEEYYNGYANRTLWPLFHYRVDLAEFERQFGSGYERVNHRMADSVMPLIEPDDLVWVHDYHLLPLGQFLRDRGVSNRIGLFLHIPWPPGRLLTSLPFHQRLVRTLLAYDVVGFQTAEWLDSFITYAERELGATVVEGGVIECEGRRVRAAAFPIGIDYDEFAAAASGPKAEAGYRRLKDSAGAKKIMIGVDRLDYSKGLVERFEAYDRFLTQHPESAKDVTLLQIAPPSREDVQTYQTIREALEGAAGRINGAHADVDWVPIRYVNQGYARAELAGFYRAADMCLVTPLRDGMNLVAKEFVAAQDPEDPGVLILSRFAGAALQLQEALLVNPYSSEEVAEAIATALRMPREERIRRWQSMIASVKDEDVLHWRDSFVTALKG